MRIRFQNLLTVLFGLIILVSMLGAADDAVAGKWKRKSQEHERACKAWCERNSPDNGGNCWKCSTKYGCGGQMHRIKSWTGYGRNWHACALGTQGQAASSDRMQECREWCDRNSESQGGQCVKCSLKLNCGQGLSTIRQFRGRGRNWYACGRQMNYREGSQQLVEQCQQWCDQNRDRCLKCLAYGNCILGQETIKMFRGRGNNVRACGWKQYSREASNRNRDACIAYCRENDCGCTTKRMCSPGGYRIQSWTGRGVNWHACR